MKLSKLFIYAIVIILIVCVIIIMLQLPWWMFVLIIVLEINLKMSYKKKGASKILKMHEAKKIEIQLKECKTDLTEEQILWEKYGKGIQYDNIVTLKEKLRELQKKLDETFH